MVQISPPRIILLLLKKPSSSLVRQRKKKKLLVSFLQNTLFHNLRWTQVHRSTAKKSLVAFQSHLGFWWQAIMLIFLFLTEAPLVPLHRLARSVSTGVCLVVLPSVLSPSVWGGFFSSCFCVPRRTFYRVKNCSTKVEQLNTCSNICHCLLKEHQAERNVLKSWAAATNIEVICCRIKLDGCFC